MKGRPRKVFPAPCARLEAENVSIEVFTLVDLDNQRELRAVLERARESYTRYGPVPLLDQFDRNASSLVYLARAKYARCEEWVSARFTPVGGKAGFARPEDFTLMRPVRGREIREVVIDRLFNGDDGRFALTSVSRICGIAPTCSERAAPQSVKLSYTAELFAAMCRQYWHDERARGTAYFSGLFRPELAFRSLSRVVEGERHPSFTRAHEVLGVDPGEVRIRRDTDAAYRFPGYFLDMREARSVLERLHAQGNLPRGVLECEDRDLGDFLCVEGRIPGAAISGEELRAVFDESVSDGPHLMLMEARQFINGTERVLAALTSGSRL